MNLKTLLKLKAASGGSKAETETPSAFSASGGTGMITPTQTNSYGTTLSTTSAADNSVDVTQVYNPGYPAVSYRNGYVCVVFTKIVDWLEDSDIRFTADISISANPAEVTQIDIYLNSKALSADITGGKIDVTYNNESPANKYYIEVRCCGCSFTLSNCMITRVARS